MDRVIELPAPDVAEQNVGEREVKMAEKTGKGSFPTTDWGLLADARMHAGGRPWRRLKRLWNPIVGM